MFKKSWISSRSRLYCLWLVPTDTENKPRARAHTSRWLMKEVGDTVIALAWWLVCWSFDWRVRALPSYCPVIFGNTSFAKCLSTPGFTDGTSELLGKLNEMQEGDPRWSGIPVQANYSLGRLNWAIETVGVSLSMSLHRKLSFKFLSSIMWETKNHSGRASWKKRQKVTKKARQIIAGLM